MLGKKNKVVLWVFDKVGNLSAIGQTRRVAVGCQKRAAIYNFNNDSAAIEQEFSGWKRSWKQKTQAIPKTDIML